MRSYFSFSFPFLLFVLFSPLRSIFLGKIDSLLPLQRCYSHSRRCPLALCRFSLLHCSLGLIKCIVGSQFLITSAKHRIRADIHFPLTLLFIIAHSTRAALVRSNGKGAGVFPVLPTPYMLELQELSFFSLHNLFIVRGVPGPNPLFIDPIID